MDNKLHNTDSSVPDLAAAILRTVGLPQYIPEGISGGQPDSKYYSHLSQWPTANRPIGKALHDRALNQGILRPAAESVAHASGATIASNPPSSFLPDLSSIGGSAMAQREAGQAIVSQTTTTEELVTNYLHRQAFGFRPAYRGDVTNPANRPAQVPSHQNCNLWITHLPSDCTESDIEDAIRDTGTIWAMHLNPADPAGGLPGAAASLSFTRRASARKLFDRAALGGLMVNGHRPRVSWNRNRVGPQPTTSDRSRVLIIAGPGQVVNEATLGEFLRRYCSYRTTGVRVLGREADGRTMMEWRFARVSGQAGIAASCLDALRSEHGIDVQYIWGDDPCEELSRMQ